MQIFYGSSGIHIENSILYQDNKSTILLAKNGRIIAGKNSKHIKNRCFLITDKVAQGDLEIQHKGTDKMWANVNTKPTQEKRFRIMRGEVVGVSAEYDNNIERRRIRLFFMPKIESARVYKAYGKILDKVSVVTLAKFPTNKSKNGILRGSQNQNK